MSNTDEDRPQKSGISTTTLREDLSRFSEHELEERLEALAGEVQRTREALAQRAKTRDAADAFFKK